MHYAVCIRCSIVFKDTGDGPTMVCRCIATGDGPIMVCRYIATGDGPIMVCRYIATGDGPIMVGRYILCSDMNNSDNGASIHSAQI